MVWERFLSQATVVVAVSIVLRRDCGKTKTYHNVIVYIECHLGVRSKVKGPGKVHGIDGLYTVS